MTFHPGFAHPRGARIGIQSKFLGGLHGVLQPVEQDEELLLLPSRVLPMDRLLPYLCPGQPSLADPLMTSHHIEPEFPSSGTNVLNPI